MQRRQFLQYAVLANLSLLNVSLLSACNKSSNSSQQSAAIDAQAFSKSETHQLLDQLLAAYEDKGFSVKDSLLPPLDAKQLLEKCTWFPGEITPELQALYAWRGGQDKGAWETKTPFWFRDNAFLSIDNAEQEYASMMESYGSEFSEMTWLKYAFPFAAFNGSWYVLPTRGHSFSPKLRYPIISVFEGIDVYYYSLQSMLATCVDWVKHPDYSKDFTLPHDVEMSIWKKYNPGIFENG